MQSRMKNPAMVLSGAMQPIQEIFKAVHSGGVSEETLELVHLRVSQINGCSACVDAGAKTARKAGVTDERLATVAAWRRPRTSPRRSARRWRWRRPRPGWPTAPTPWATTSGTPPPPTSTRSSWPRSS